MCLTQIEFMYMKQLERQAKIVASKKPIAETKITLEEINKKLPIKDN